MRTRTPRPPILKMTTQFMLLYGFLALLPALVFIGSYSAQVSNRQRQEIWYQEKLFLSQTAASLNQAIVSMGAVADTLTMNSALMDMLEGVYPTASDELMAYIRVIQPALTQSQAANPGLRGMYIYRFNETFLSDSDLLFATPMVSIFPYDPAWLLCSGEPCGMIVTPADPVRRLYGETLDTALYVSFTRVFDRSFSQQVGLIETQLDMDRALTELGIPQDRGALELRFEGRWYPIRITARGAHLDDPLPDSEAATIEKDRTLIIEPVGLTRMELAYAFDPSLGQSAVGATVSMALLLLLPTLLAYWFVYRLALRLSRFGQHIQQTDASSPTAYEKKQPDDELGDVVSAYNTLVLFHKELLDQVRSAERMKNAATYYAMSSQVNPHFMFNTLENIRMRIEVERYDDASRMLQTLARFLRYNISLRQDSSLEEELCHIERYLVIYQYRMHSRIEYSVNRPDDAPLNKVRCPFCMLQPLLENCLRHGIRDEKPLIITVSIEPSDDDWLIVIADNGSGMRPDEIESMNESLQAAAPTEQAAQAQVGLSNVNARIKYFYGSGYGLRLESNGDGGLTVRVLIGWKAADAV
ncbi:MAG: histidine kinase [Oscillospiraceae bacterium]|nr:histidine kinase [Oscillospiraceae bacterium]